MCLWASNFPDSQRKIEETIKYGGDQLLLQGGHHPKLGLDYYVSLFNDLIQNYKITIDALVHFVNIVFVFSYVLIT